MCMLQLINEPWAGDIYSKPSLLLPGVSGKVNLQSLYNQLNTAIRSVDERTLIFYEPVTWSIFVTSQQAGTGFTAVPGGTELVFTDCFFIIIIITSCERHTSPCVRTTVFRGTQNFEPSRRICPFP